MSICTIFAMLQDLENKRQVGSLQKQYQMNKWLESHGIKDYTYEIHKCGKIHSRWIWKEKTERLGRTATPTDKIPSEYKKMMNRVTD